MSPSVALPVFKLRSTPKRKRRTAADRLRELAAHLDANSKPNAALHCTVSARYLRRLGIAAAHDESVPMIGSHPVIFIRTN